MCLNQNLVLVQTAPFQQQEIYRWLSENKEVGATVVFVGKVRHLNQGHRISGLFLEHYPDMTKKALMEIVNEARCRWQLERVALIHRIGHLQTNDEIVLVGTSAMHRLDAYQANQFIMDYLKTQVPFWKKEKTEQGERWVEGQDSDQKSAQKWQ